MSHNKVTNSKDTHISVMWSETVGHRNKTGLRPTNSVLVLVLVLQVSNFSSTIL